MKQQRRAVRMRKKNLGRAGKGRADRPKARQVQPPGDMRYAALKYTDEMVKGRISINSRGFGFVTPEGMQKNRADIFIPKDELHTAMNGDMVQVQLAQELAVADGHGREGRVTEVLERANSRIVGIYSASRRFGFVAPDDTRLKTDIYIPEGEAMDAVTGSKVVAEVTRWPDGRQKAEGRIIEVIGQKGEPGAVSYTHLTLPTR